MAATRYYTVRHFCWRRARHAVGIGADDASGASSHFIPWFRIPSVTYITRSPPAWRKPSPWPVLRTARSAPRTHYCDRTPCQVARHDRSHSRWLGPDREYPAPVGPKTAQDLPQFDRAGSHQHRRSDLAPDYQLRDLGHTALSCAQSSLIELKRLGLPGIIP